MRRPRIRIGTLMLLVVIAAMASGLVVQQHRATRREAEHQARIAELRMENAKLQVQALSEKLNALVSRQAEMAAREVAARPEGR